MTLTPGEKAGSASAGADLQHAAPAQLLANGEDLLLGETEPAGDVGNRRTGTGHLEQARSRRVDGEHSDGQLRDDPPGATGRRFDPDTFAQPVPKRDHDSAVGPGAFAEAPVFPAGRR